MPMKMIYMEDAKRALKAGLDQLADTIRITFGPKGGKIVLESRNGPPLITGDGLSIAMKLKSEDPFEEMGVELIKEVAVRTKEAAGDGSSTATILAQAMVSYGMQYIASGAKSVLLRRGIEIAVKMAVDYLQHSSLKVISLSDIKAVATVAAGDYSIGQLISDAAAKVSADGILRVEEAECADTSFELVDGVGIIKVGAFTEVERKEKRLRIEAALAAARAAKEEGMVAGGGVALLSAAGRLERMISKYPEDEKRGILVVMKALEEPIRQLVINSGKEASVIIDTIKKVGRDNYGYDALNEKYCNMIESGIVDPVKVIRLALQHAASVAGLILAAKGLVANVEAEDKPCSYPAPEPV